MSEIPLKVKRMMMKKLIIHVEFDFEIMDLSRTCLESFSLRDGKGDRKVHLCEWKIVSRKSPDQRHFPANCLHDMMSSTLGLYRFEVLTVLLNWF